MKTVLNLLDQDMVNPLQQMLIRTAELDSVVTSKEKLNFKSSPVGGIFGYVRSLGIQPHQGWDLYAAVGTSIYAISKGKVEYVRDTGKKFYGLQVCLHFRPQGYLSAYYPKGLYAFYAHLLQVRVKTGDLVMEGQILGATGTSGNAENTPPHLHFEIRTIPYPPYPSELHWRINPGDILGYQFYTCSR